MNSIPNPPKLYVPHSIRRTDIRQNYDGFSLLELVVAVSIMLILGVVGFVAYQNYTDNARQAAVESAADQVLTATIAAHNTPDRDPTAEVISFNQTSDDIVANIDTASATELAVRAEDTVGTFAVARTAGNFSGIEETSFSATGATYGWEGQRHNSISVKYEQGKVVARNLVNNPRFKNNAYGWKSIERGGPNEIDSNPLQIVSSEGLFEDMAGHPAIGDEVLHITRKNTENATGSIYAQMEMNAWPDIEGYSHIGYAAPMQGTGKLWMYFRSSNTVPSRTGYVEDEPTHTLERGGWISGIAEIPQNTKYADIYLGSAYESSKPEGQQYVNEVYYGSPMIVVGHSAEDVEAQLSTYFDGDSQ